MGWRHGQGGAAGAKGRELSPEGRVFKNALPSCPFPAFTARRFLFAGIGDECWHNFNA